MRWCNGRPCEAINMYFLDIAPLTTGDTIITYASQLSHLVRFCSHQFLPFDNLTDAYIHDFSVYLQEEPSEIIPHELARNNNTIRTILGRVFLFLEWYQDNLTPLNKQLIIGEKKSSPKIRVNYKLNRYNNKDYIEHSSMPPSVSTDPKRPIAQSIIENIELTIEKLSLIETQSEYSLRRYKNNIDVYKMELEYIRSRRRFMIWMMKRVGLRPSEMVGIDVNSHINILITKVILIPTKKRRRKVSPIRSFPITIRDATIFKRYLTSRSKFIEAFPVKTTDSEALFLGNDGGNIKKTSLEKDFHRLAVLSGYQDIQACFSMFRHRFITYEVIVHFKEFMKGTGKSRQLMTDIDYRSILKRVATKTGHGSVESLWHYIDLAWDELNVWGNIDRGLERLRAVDSLYEELLELQHDININKSEPPKKILDIMIDKLKNIIIEGQILKSSKLF
jgi:site-specific recombinase XerD